MSASAAAPRPEALHRLRGGPRQSLHRHLVEGHGPLFGLHENRIPAEAPEPVPNRGRVSHAPAQEQEPGLRRGQSDAQLVVHPAGRVADHLVFVHHEQRWAIAPQEPLELRLQRRYHHRRVEVLREVACRDPHVPARLPPLRELVVRQRPGRDREHAPAALCIVFPHHPRLPRAGRGIDHDILPLLQRPRRLLLPEIPAGRAKR